MISDDKYFLYTCEIRINNNRNEKDYAFVNDNLY